jgi:hypothetical protein
MGPPKVLALGVPVVPPELLLVVARSSLVSCRVAKSVVSFVNSNMTSNGSVLTGILEVVVVAAWKEGDNVLAYRFSLLFQGREIEDGITMNPGGELIVYTESG